MLYASDRASGGQLGYRTAASGSTFAALGAGAVYVYVEPPSGWSGTIVQAAKLTASDGTALTSLAVSGDTIAAAGGNRVYVFVKPAGGWAKTAHEVARLTAAGASTLAQVGVEVAFDGSSIIAAAPYAYPDLSVGAQYVFARPAGGWRGFGHQQAEIDYRFQDETLGPQIAANGGTLSWVADYTGDGHECPCEPDVFAVNRPSDGWHGTFSASPAIPVNSNQDVRDYAGPDEIATDGENVLIATENAVDVYSLLQPPQLSNVSLTGLTAGQPRLSLRLREAGPTPIGALTITLPRGEAFTPATQGDVGIRITGARATKIARSGRSMTMRLSAPTGPISIQIPAAALSQTAQLTRQIDAAVRRNRANRHRQSTAVSLDLAVSATIGGRETAPARAAITIT
jgi:hypothetical protein